MRSKLAVLALVLAMAAPVLASSSDKVLKFDDIRTQQAEIRAGVEAGSGRYKNLPVATRDELLRRQSQVLATIDGKQADADLTQEQRSEVVSNLEWIEAAINHEQAERIVCEYRTTIGSNRKTRVCHPAPQESQGR